MIDRSDILEEDFKRVKLIEPLIVSIVNKYCFNYDVREDWLQEALITATLATSKYRDDMNTSYTTYIYSVVENMFKNKIRDAKAQKRALFETVHVENEERWIPLECTYDWESEIRLREFYCSLNEKNRLVLACRMNNLTLKETAEVVNMSIRKVRTHLTRIQKEWEKFNDNTY